MTAKPIPAIPFALGIHVVVKRDRMAEQYPRVRPQTGHTGIVKEVRDGPFFQRVLVELDVVGTASWFHSDELEVQP